MTCVELLIRWIVTGMIAWVILAISAAVYCYSTFRLDQEILDYLDENPEMDEVFLEEHRVIGWLYIVAEVVLWPVCIILEAKTIIDMARRGIDWKQNRCGR